MRKLIILILIYSVFIPSLIAQTENKHEELSDSIEHYAKLLTGKWKLTGYYKNNQFNECIISSRYIDSLPGQRIDKVITRDGLKVKVYLKDSLVSIDKFNCEDVIELKFNKTGKGYYQRYPDYVIGREWQDYREDQPSPKIVFENGKYFIELVYLAGTTIKYFNIKTDTLYLTENNESLKYGRLVE